MELKAAESIERGIGKNEPMRIKPPEPEPAEALKAMNEPFTPYKGKIRKSGTGCVTMINDHLYEGRFTPTNADGKRISCNIYAKTREECEEKLAALIIQKRAEIKAEKERRKKEGHET